MADDTIARLAGCLDRLRAGDEAARTDLLNHACGVLHALTRKMFKDYARVRRWEESGDVAQNAALRLWRTLQAVTPGTVREFLRLAALQIRRELIDLARHHYGPEGAGARHSTQGGDGGLVSDTPRPVYDEPDGTRDPGRLAVWTEFHRQAGALPEDEREVFDLLWYQGLTQAAAAGLLGVDERTVKRRWQAARLSLSRRLHGESPAG